ncbi:hypothetical protein [Pseudomonas veronii]|uniref:Uncharacterized protein n=1 Tax=Pseudomonas veronii TaxID=76761 RepID=A0A4P7YBY4_PSEVE|nr:hypothetical protein [Pseudomonas veronii]QCG68253.1 hypothetical protein E4167_30575 [Pseudomonas veronii]
MNIKVQANISWSDLVENGLTKNSFDQLLGGQIPYIQIANFASHEECDALVASAVKEGFGPYRGVEPVINRIGNTIFEYSGISRHEYFQKNVELSRAQRRIFDSSFGHLERFISLLRQKLQRSACVAKNIM